MTAVVKLGGSLATAGTLRSWMAVISEAGAGRCVVVPGGGVFADAVRAAQQRLGFSDRAAHGMALLAMEQYARLLNDIEPAWRLCASAKDIGAALGAGAVALWLPLAMVEADPTVAASWDVTSDSLAAWLARRLGAAQLVLVKSAPPTGPVPLSAKRLVESGVVDAAFPAYLAGTSFGLIYCGPGDQPRLADALGLG